MRQPAHADVPLNTYRVTHPARARVLSNERITPLDCDEVRHLVLDLAGLGYCYLEGQSMGVLTPGTDPLGHLNKLRLYSIASSRQGDDGSGQTASLCVKRVVYVDNETGERKHGVASNYLCDLRRGDSVSITGPVGKSFLLPDDPASNLIMLATGTGIAPFRAFLAHVFGERPAWTGQVYLFFGAKRTGECLYRTELELYQAQPNFTFVTALSREEQASTGERMYVHHRMSERLDVIWNLLMDEKTYMYICGIKGMEALIAQVLHARAAEAGVDWPALAHDLRHVGRLLIETY